jgi:TonB family protein
MTPVPAVCPSCGASASSDTLADGLCAACLLDHALLDALEGDRQGSSEDFVSGATFAGLRIVRLLGAGGMASVYEAYDDRLDRLIALKVLSPALLHDATFAQRFAQEARLVARIAHPHIVPVYASGIANGVPWMTMRLLTGGTVGPQQPGVIRPLADTLRILRDIATALDHAHGAGVIHRDVKTSNILLDDSGAASLSDFGLARLLEGGRNLTRAGAIAGTPQYMSPEQALGQDVDHRSDIYSLGVVAYELLTGTLPFDDDAPLAVLLKHVNAPVPLPAVLSPRTFSVISTALSKNVVDRWPTATAFVDALSAAGQVPRVTTARKRPHLSQTLTALVTLITIGIGAALVAGRGGVLAPLPPDASLWLRSSGLVAVELATASDPFAMPSAAVSEPRGRGLGPSARTPAAVPVDLPIYLPGDSARLPSEPVPPSVFTDPVETPTVIAGAANLPVAPSLTPAAADRDGIVQPIRVQWARPVYPPLARAAEIEGDVLLVAHVGSDGSVLAVDVVQAAHPLLADAARQAVLRYRYTPGTRNGTPQRFDVRVTVQFRLQ